MYAKIAITLLFPAMLCVFLAGCNSHHDLTAEVSLGAVAPTQPGAELFSSATSSGGAQLSVLSFNMEHKDKPAHLAILATHLRSDLAQIPNFILLQEVMFKRAISKGHSSTAAVLAEKLGYYCRGTKRSSDREGIAILSRYPFDYYDDITLDAQTSRLLLGFNRVSVMGEFLVPGAGRVRVVNVHFTNWGFEEHVRYQQLRETLQWMNNREQEVHADVTILGGDFNMPPKSHEASLITQANFADEWEFHDWNTANPTRGGHGHPTQRVDYLYVSAVDRNVKMIGPERLLWQDGLLAKPGKKSSRFFLSDHVPLLHEYAIGPASLPAIAQGASEQPNP